MKKSKEEKLAEKKLQKELDYLVDEEIKQEKENEPSAFNAILHLFDKDPDEEEFDNYYQENYREEYEEEKRENKRLLITVSSVGVGVITIVVVALIIFSNMFKSDLLKITKPMLESYYSEKYKDDNNINEIEYLKQYNPETKKQDDTNIALATMSNNSHVMCVDNNIIGDDIDTDKVYNSYQEYKTANFSDFNIIVSNPNISYSDYYLKYSIFYDYSKVLPNGISFDDMVASKKITINDVWIYQGELDIDRVMLFMNSINSNSKIYAIKQEAGFPTSLTVFESNAVLFLPVASSVQLDNDITYFSFDRNYCDVSKLEVKKVNSNSITSSKNLDFNNSYMISVEKVYKKKEEPVLPMYYLLKFSNHSLNSNNLVLLNNTRYSKEKIQMYENDFPEASYIDFSDILYLIGNSSMGVSNTKENDSFLCKLNLC